MWLYVMHEKVVMCVVVARAGRRGAGVHMYVMKVVCDEDGCNPPACVRGLAILIRIFLF